MRRDGGSASVWVLVCGALVGLVATAATARTCAIGVRHHAQAAADLAALAAAARIGIDSGSCSAARHIATANGTDLLACELSPGPDGRSGQIRVVVRVETTLPFVGHRTVTASSRAARAPGGSPG